MELGYEKAEDSISRFEYSDNWFRTFRGIPKFEKHEKAMLNDFIEKGKITKAVIYLTADRFVYALDSDYAEFVVREFIRGNIG